MNPNVNKVISQLGLAMSSPWHVMGSALPGYSPRFRDLAALAKRCCTSSGPSPAWPSYGSENDGTPQLWKLDENGKMMDFLGL